MMNIGMGSSVAYRCKGIRYKHHLAPGQYGWLSGYLATPFIDVECSTALKVVWSQLKSWSLIIL